MTDGQHPAQDRGLPHRSVRIEARVHAVVERNLRSRGWSPRVFAHTGYAGTTWARVLGRVLLVPPGGPRRVREDRRGWRRFVTTSAGDIPVTVRIGTESHVVPSGHDGYLDVLLPAQLEPGWTTVQLSVGDAEPVAATVRVVGPTTKLGVVSDVDDTVIQTMLPRPLVAFRNAFLVRENARRTVSGMAELYRGDRQGAPRRLRRLPLDRRLEHCPGADQLPEQARLPAGTASAHRLGADPAGLVPLGAGAQARPARPPVR